MLERLQGACETLAVRGLRAAGPKDLATLEALERELSRFGATHLAGRITGILAIAPEEQRPGHAVRLARLGLHRERGGCAERPYARAP